jgi:hypothetical protein
MGYLGNIVEFFKKLKIKNIYLLFKIMFLGKVWKKII